MHYAIFIPRAEGYAPDKMLASVGLESLHDSFCCAGIADHELDEQSGKLLTWGCVPIPERWWWDGAKRFAVGFDRVPSPDDLLRCGAGNKTPADSFPVVLQDDQEWYVPIARRLPQQWSQGPDGRPTLATKPAFAWYWDGFVDALDRFENRGFAPDSPPADLFEFAVRALAMNYRICPEVVYATGLMGPTDVMKIIAAMGEHSHEFAVEHVYTVKSENALVTQKKTAKRRLANVT